MNEWMGTLGQKGSANALLQRGQGKDVTHRFSATTVATNAGKVKVLPPTIKKFLPCRTMSCFSTASNHLLAVFFYPF